MEQYRRHSHMIQPISIAQWMGQISVNSYGPGRHNERQPKQSSVLRSLNASF